MANNIIKRIWNQNRMVNIEDLCGMAFQAESGGHTFEISGVDDTGAVVPLSGTVAGVFRRPDNADIALTGAADGGVASVTLTDDCYAVPGRFGLTIFVTSGGQKTAVYAAIGTVAATNGGAVAGDTPQDVVDLINAIEAAIAEIPASYTDIMAAIAPIYSSSSVYAVGAYSWYDGELYRCVTPITSGETWDSSHWAASDLDYALNVVNSENRFDYESTTEETANLFTPDFWSDLSLGIKYENGEFISTNSNLSKLIIVPYSKISGPLADGNVTITFEYMTETDNEQYSFGVGCFDANNTRLTSINNVVPDSLTFRRRRFVLPVPANTHHIKFMYVRNGNMIVHVKNIQAEVGGVVSDYVPNRIPVDSVAREAIDTETEERKSLESELGISKEFSAVDTLALATDDWPLGWRTGSIDETTGVENQSTNYIRTLSGGTSWLARNEIFAPYNARYLHASVPDGYYIAVYEYDANDVYIKRYGFPNNNIGLGTNRVDVPATAGYIYKIVVGYSESGDAAEWLTSSFINSINLEFEVATLDGKSILPAPFESNTSNYTIVSAKETNYADGTPPSVEWYLVLSPDNDFYITKDFCTGRWIFRADDYNPLFYKYGVMKNGDIIAVFRTEHSSSGSSEDSRENPFVYLASENWTVKHIVDFGNNLKPSGWLENCGFCSMPNGDAMFCEYTRPSVVTANCWKLHGDITSPSAWTVVKSFTLSGLPNEGFKHCHSVCYDFYNDVYYLTTGDDDVGAQVWYSLNDGATWTIAREPSEKYCRVLNMIFTHDYIYWASDTTKANMHYLFRCGRSNGVIDYSTITELANLYVPLVATYGLVYIEEYNAIVILDKADSAVTSIPFRIYDIDSGTLSTMKTLYTADGEAQQIGFRTEYSEFMPNGKYVLCGFGKKLSLAIYRNFIKALGNAGDPDGWDDNVNNLRIEIFKNGNGYGCRFKTAFMPR